MKVTDDLHVKFRHDVKKGFTYVQILASDHPLPVVETFSRVGDGDTYSREVGRSISLMRALVMARNPQNVSEGTVRRMLTANEVGDIYKWFLSKFNAPFYPYSNLESDFRFVLRQCAYEIGMKYHADPSRRLMRKMLYGIFVKTKS